MSKTLNPLGWGYTEDALSEAERDKLLRAAAGWFGGKVPPRRPPPQDVSLPAARLPIPDALTACVTADHGARLLHARGRSFRDLAELRGGTLSAAPDAVATPRSHEELLAVLEWADRHRYAVIPYGGGSSVVGGVNPENMDDFPGVVTLSLRGLNRVLDVDATSRTVRAQAGILGPDLEAALKPHGLAVRHFPQSYFHSTLGGWVATRGAGHFSTLHAKIEDRVQALTVVLPDGRVAQTRKLPASSIGPDPNRLWCGSEGFLGVITEVDMRCVGLPQKRAACGIRFKTFEAAMEAGRTMLQAGIYPTQMRILDPYEHLISRALSGRAASGALMVLAFESAGAPLNEAFAAAQDLTRARGGEGEEPRFASTARGGSERTAKDGRAGGSKNRRGRAMDGKDETANEAVSDWRSAFFRQPYVRDALLDHAIISDTFETAVPWSEAPALYHAVRAATLTALQKVCGAGAVTCRSTHAYTDGLCLYFAFFGAGRHDGLVAQWREIRAAAAEAVLAHGGTASHHHAMGRDHARWAAAEIPAPFRAAIRAAKRALDPNGILNPGLWFAE